MNPSPVSVANPPHSVAAADGSPAPASASFSERIRLLIQRVGSATEIARMCGFSEGVVRSWRDGNSDPSRARCVTLAKTLGISLVWLVAGEGTIQSEAMTNAGEGTAAAEVKRTSDERASEAEVVASAQTTPVTHRLTDTRRLDAAKRVLQSGLDLSGLALTPSDHAEMLITLYEIVGPSGNQIDAAALLAFNQQLAARAQAGRRQGVA